MLLIAAGVPPVTHASHAAAGGLHAGLAASPRFHHIHLVPGEPNGFADYYARLFIPGRVDRGEFWGHPGVRDARAALLFSAGGNQRRGDRSVVWQMGWGTVSLDHSYRQHYAREVDWAPPYASLSAELHLHLRTGDARKAAEWYRDVLGGAIELSRDVASAPEGVTTALVRFDGLTLALHATRDAIAPSREAGTVDHVAFEVGAFADLPVEPAVQAPGAPYTLRSRRTALLTAPDGLLIEIIESR